MERYLCIHCHFYQPPRENPWLEAVEIQDSAYPYHDWNQRITAECYAPNSAARILDGEGHIVKIVNNYSRISFNFGPTLLSWMEDNTPRTYEAILEADRLSRRRFSGHGSAIAQAYNHMILPLANRRDKHTQALWGIRDFEHRFGRAPEGMWLPETAVDVDSLEVLAELGIKFTILAPHQARQVRKSGKPWRNVEDAKIDPTRPYLCRLPSGQSINLFFYDGPISRAVAFEKLLSSGEHFANRLLSGFNDRRRWAQLMHIATDGETYGHHHPHGDMALAYALDYIESRGLARITNYGEFLEKHPPVHEVEIAERTAWSCAHGVGRWMDNCGCNSGGHGGWTQQWRGPLRTALDWLRDDLAQPYEHAAAELLRDPWAARNDYISAVLDRGPQTLDGFFARHAPRRLSHDDQVRALKLLEMQRHLMLMYTSCGWFFDELTGLETTQVIQYAARALQLSEDIFGDGREQHFVELLSHARSNLPEMGSGADVFQRWAKSAALNLLGVGAHYAISSLFDARAERDQIFCYDVELQDAQRWQSGKAQLMVGRASVCSRITREDADVTFGVLHFGDHNLSAGVRPFLGDDSYRQLLQDASAAFTRADLPQSLRILDRHFAGTSYSLKSLFRDEQRRIVRRIFDSVLSETEASYSQIYEHHAALLRFLSELRAPVPRVLRVTAEFVINSELRRLFEDSRDLDLDRVQPLLDAARREDIPLDSTGLEFALRRRLNQTANAWEDDPENPRLLEQVEKLADLAHSLPFTINLWRAQNVYYRVARQLLRDPQHSERVTRVGDLLGVSLAAEPQVEVAA
ncbi:MAG TPA: DUF3536 domain-containing protein [Terriglobales bacterium]|nr:DUF3536 domain-containing protein [Terriglobales bacterium]